MYEGRRVGVFLDALNLAYSFRNMPDGRGHGHIVDFKSILEDCATGRNVVKAIAYSGEEPYFSELNNVLASAGYEVRKKKGHTRPGGKRKCNWDVGMAVDALRMAPKLDTVVLLTGDVDFIDLVKPLREEYLCQVEVRTFREFAHADLLDAVNTFVSLDPEKYLVRVSSVGLPVPPDPVSAPVSDPAPDREPAQKQPPISLKRTPEFYRRERK